MTARPDDRDIAFMPVAIHEGPCRRLGGSVHFHPNIPFHFIALVAMEDALPSIVNRHGTTNRGPDAVARSITTR
jgi:hypothetical protein